MASRHYGRLLCVSAIACTILHFGQVAAFAWTHDTGEVLPDYGGSWYACGTAKATSANVNDSRYARWYPAWDFRGRFRFDIRVPCATNDRGKNVLHHVRRTDGTEYQSVTFSQCGLSGWYNLFGDTNWNGDGDRYSRVYFYPYADTAYPNCYTGYNAVTAGQGHTYGEKWDYINDWVCLGGYSGTISDNATGWTESDIYLYPAVDTTHGNVFNYGGKTPGRVQTGDCNWENKLNWKGNAAGYGNCDNCYSYGFAWMYAPGGAGPKFLIGADDDQRTYVNGTLVSSGSSCCNRDNFETGGVSMPAGWSRILFKVRNGGGGFDGTVSLRNGGDRGWNEGSVTRYGSSYGLGYEQDDWYPRIEVANFYGSSNPHTIGSTVGDPTVDIGTFMMYFGAGDGRVYAVTVPFVRVDDATVYGLLRVGGLMPDGPFSVNQIYSVKVKVIWRGVPAGTHAQKLRFYTPEGTFYQSVNTTFSTGSSGDAVEVWGELPIAGTWAERLLGTWRVDVLLDNDTSPFKSESFVLQN